jgi:hypothetical protein
MLELPCDLYSSGKLVLSGLRIWVDTKLAPDHEGFFHVPADLGILSGARYHLELHPEGAKRLGLTGRPSLEVSTPAVPAQFAPFAPLAPLNETALR